MHACAGGLPEQAQHDYLAGNYPVVREDAAQMCALQMQAEGGPSAVDGPEALEAAIERFVHKQASAHAAPPPALPAMRALDLLACRLITLWSQRGVSESR